MQIKIFKKKFTNNLFIVYMDDIYGYDDWNTGEREWTTGRRETQVENIRRHRNRNTLRTKAPWILKNTVPKYRAVSRKHPSVFCRRGVSYIVRRSDRIRTCDPLVPNQIRYRTALHSETTVVKKKKADHLMGSLPICRGDWIRTSDLQLPKLAR